MNNYKIISIDKLTNSTVCLKTERPNIEIKAGQCFSVGLPELSINREYSMYSDERANYLEFLIKIIDDGSLTKYFKNLRQNDVLELNGPFGEFCLNQPNMSNLKYLFIASGTGIAPFRSFLKSYKNIDYKLLHGIRFENERYHYKEYQKNRYIPCISRCSKKPKRVTDHLKDLKIDKNTHIYICGNRSMIADVLNILEDKKIHGDQIFTEVFF